MLGRRVVFLFQLECHCLDVLIEIDGPSAADSSINQHPKTFAPIHVAQEGANACSGLKTVRLRPLLRVHENVAPRAENSDVVDLGFVASDDVQRCSLAKARNPVVHMLESGDGVAPKLCGHTRVRQKGAHALGDSANAALSVGVGK